MSVLWKIEFYKAKSDWRSIIIVAWGLGQSPGGLSVGKAQNCLKFGFLISLRQLNDFK